jgi:hypothetical protein
MKYIGNAQDNKSYDSNPVNIKNDQVKADTMSLVCLNGKKC